MMTSPASSSMRSGKSSKASTPPSPPSSTTTPRRLYSYGCMTPLSAQLMSSTSPCPPLLPINHSLITMRQRLRHMCGVREPAGGKYDEARELQDCSYFVFSSAWHIAISSSFPRHGTATSWIVLLYKPSPSAHQLLQQETRWNHQ
ncbi:hypothetical protein TB1_045986 [Malus domestica]